MTDKPKLIQEVFSLGRMATTGHFANSARFPSLFHMEVPMMYAGISKALATTMHWILLKRQPGWKHLVLVTAVRQKQPEKKQKEQKMQVLSAEAQFVQFVAEHNLSF